MLVDDFNVSFADEEQGDKLLSFKPHPGQRAVIESPARFKIVLGANRTGKTEIGATEVISYALGFRPYLAKDDPFYYTPFKPPVKIRIGAENLRKGIGEVIQKKLKMFVPKVVFDPKNGIGKSRADGNTGVDLIWEFPNGSSIEFLSYDMDYEAMEGWDGHLIWADEPPPKSFYNANVRGLTDHMGHMIFTNTPLKEPWVIKEVFNQADILTECGRERTNDREYQKKQVFQREVRKSIHAFNWDITCNVGYGLTWEKIDAFAAVVDPEEAECRLHGKPLHFSGLVFKEFNRPSHVIEGELDDTRPYTFYESYDPHPRTPHAVSFYAVGENGIPIKYDEIGSRHQGKNAVDAETLAKMVIARRKGDPVWMVADPSAFIEVHNGMSFADQLCEASGGRIVLEKGSKDLDNGILAIRGALRVVNKVAGYNILEKCEQTIDEYEGLVYDEHRGRTADRKTESNKPMDKDDHMVECDRRAFLGGMRFLAEFAYLNSKPYYEHEDYQQPITMAAAVGRDSVTGY